MHCVYCQESSDFVVYCAQKIEESVHLIMVAQLLNIHVLPPIQGLTCGMSSLSLKLTADGDALIAILNVSETWEC